MEHTKKMTLVPVQSVPTVEAPQNATQAPYFISSNPIKSKKTAGDKFLKSLKIGLRLARIDGFDEIGRLRLNNKIIENSDIVSLMNHAMSFGRVLIGENEFIELLYKANIDPTMIINNNVKEKLLSRMENTNDINHSPPPPEDSLTSNNELHENREASTSNNQSDTPTDIRPSSPSPNVPVKRKNESRSYFYRNPNEEPISKAMRTETGKSINEAWEFPDSNPEMTGTPPNTWEVPLPDDDDEDI